MNTTIRKLLAVSLVGFGIFCFLKGLPSSVTRDAANGVMPGAVASIHSKRPTLPAAEAVKTRAIQDIRVGQRVLAKNPEISNLDRRTRGREPDFSNWLQLSLEMPKPDGSTLHIEMLRSEEWLRNQIGFVIGENPDRVGERQGVSPPSAIECANPNSNPPSPKTENLKLKTFAPLSPLRPIFNDIAFASVAAEAEGVELVGLTVDLELPEMGACGTAVITGISTTPEIELGEGQVVTATFRHPPSNTVLDVVFVDEGTSLDQHTLAVAKTTVDPAASAYVVTAPSTQFDTASKPIGVTDNHLFWSEDRGEFIEIGRMEIGERVRTLFGKTKILAQKLPRPGPPAEVYNLEVREEHVYFVGDDCVLAHNACDNPLPVINREFTPDTARIVAGLTDRAVQDLASNPSIARSLMSQGSYRALVTRSGQARASYGKAVERLVARNVREDAFVSSILRHTGQTRGANGRFVSSPDFIGNELYNIQRIDITTARELAKHQRRSFSDGTRYVFHPGLPENIRFPR